MVGVTRFGFARLLNDFGFAVKVCLVPRAVEVPAMETGCTLVAGTL